MAEKMNGLSLEFIIHPGETVKEILDERKMTQEELAIRTGFSPKHISEVVNGLKGISPSFAKSLEYVFGMPASFWINLQGIYDREMLDFEEQENIDKDEVTIVESLKKLIKYAEEKQIMSKGGNVASQIIELRNICNVKNLTYINNLFTSKVAFRKSTTIETNVYVLYVWIRICEIMAENNNVKNDFNLEKLINRIDDIKKCMFMEINKSIEELKKIFGECGIVFQVVKNFTGAPVQGFIKKMGNKVLLSMTIRGAFADVFWFSLFHEIGHLVNGDLISNNFIDFMESKSDMEDKADDFAMDKLIDREAYKKFISKEKITENELINFAKEQKVQPFIVVGRLQKDKGDYRLFYKLKVRYGWK